MLVDLEAGVPVADYELLFESNLAYNDNQRRKGEPCLVKLGQFKRHVRS